MITNKVHFKFNKLKLEKLEDKCLIHRIVAKKMGVVYAEYAKGWVHRNITHKNEEFLYVLTGSLQAKIGNKRCILNKNEAALIPVNVPHSFIATKKTKALIVFAPPITSKQAKAIMKKAAKKK